MEHSTELNSAQKIKATPLEARQLASFKHKTPLLCFGKTEGKGTAMDPEDGFGHKFGTFEKFSGRKSLPARQEVEGLVNSLISSIRGVINSLGRSSGVGQNLARFLLTEALRGEGAILRDANGRAFARDFHIDAELAPRDVVARGVYAEAQKCTEDGVHNAYLDIESQVEQRTKELQISNDNLTKAKEDAEAAKNELAHF